MSNHLNDAPRSVLSNFNPMISIHPDVQKQVNDNFLNPILGDFFKLKGGIANFDFLDTQKLKTEMDFEKEPNFVKAYLYEEITNTISRKSGSHLVDFKPKYVITFDKSLAPYEYDSKTRKIKYGTICFGNAPVLYYILIDLQELIDFIKAECA